MIVKKSIPIRGLILGKYRKGQIWENGLIRMWKTDLSEETIVPPNLGKSRRDCLFDKAVFFFFYFMGTHVNTGRRRRTLDRIWRSRVDARCFSVVQMFKVSLLRFGAVASVELVHRFVGVY